jgi:hypothetical protein
MQNNTLENEDKFFATEDNFDIQKRLVALEEGMMRLQEQYTRCRQENRELEILLEQARREHENNQLLIRLLKEKANIIEA